MVGALAVPPPAAQELLAWYSGARRGIWIEEDNQLYKVLENNIRSHHDPTHMHLRFGDDIESQEQVWGSNEDDGPNLCCDHCWLEPPRFGHRDDFRAKAALLLEYR